MLARVIVEPSPQPQALAQPRGFTVAKRHGEPNEDCWQHSRKGVGAVSDGASVSFDSAAWARILARRFAQRPHLDEGWLAEAIAAYAALHDRDSLPWMQQAAFDRGSFASLLGVTGCGGGRIAILAVGDSLAVLCDGDRVVGSFPYEMPEQFDERPLLLSTAPVRNGFLDDPECRAGLCREWDLGELQDPALLLVTDALGRWILARRERKPSPIAQLRAIGSPRRFARLVEAERAAGRLRRDDTTLLAYWDCSAAKPGTNPMATRPC